MNTAAWAIGLAVVLAVVAALVGAFGTAGYIIAGRRLKQPFFVFMVRYCIVFVLLILLEMVFLWLVPSVHETLRNLTASVVGGVLSAAGVANSISGSLITVEDPHLVFSIDVACLGGILFWSYIALVLAESRATRKQRLIGIIVGVAALVLFNLFRISVSVYMEWRTGINVHNYFYLLNMVFVMMVWAAWLWRLKLTRSAKGQPA